MSKNSRKRSVYATSIRVGCLLAAVLATPSSALVGQDVAAELERVTVSGRVLDDVTRLPIAGALAELVELGVGVQTNPSGQFEITGLPLGVYTLRLTHDAYLPSSGEFGVTQGGTFVTTLTPLNAASRPPAGRFLGVVTDQSGVPLDGAEIQIRDAFMGTLSAEEGRFRFDAVPPGQYAVDFSYLGYETRSEVIEIRSGMTSTTTIPLAVDPIEMDPIEVVVERRELNLEDIGFYDRRDQGFGQFIDLQLIESRRPQQVSDLFQNLPGVRLESNPYEPLQRTIVLRGGRMGAGARTGGADHCYPLVTLDGQVVHRGRDVPGADRPDHPAGGDLGHRGLP